MKNERTLKEVCAILNISRRAIQGYEKNNLVKHTSKNKYGHLLYDEAMINRIAFIQFLQQIGFTQKEISTFIDLSNQEIKEILTNRIQYLEAKKEEMNSLVLKTYSYIQQLE